MKIKISPKFTRAVFIFSLACLFTMPTMLLAAGPTISIGTSSMTFNAAATCNPDNQTAPVTNSGTGSLTGMTTSIQNNTTGAAWIAATLDTSTAPATLNIGINVSDLSVGSYTATVNVLSSVATNSPQSIPVTLNVTPSTGACTSVPTGAGTSPSAGGTCSFNSTNSAPSTNFCNPIQSNNVGDLFYTITKFLIGIMGGVAIVMIVIGGFRMIIADGNAEAVKGARSTITWAIIGLVISLLAYSLVAIVESALSGASNRANS